MHYGHYASDLMELSHMEIPCHQVSGIFFFIKNRAGKGYISESLKTSPVNEQKSVITVWGTVHKFKVVICCILFLIHISEVTATHIIGAPDFQHCETVECCDL